jgi:hypothetical protein
VDEMEVNWNIFYNNNAAIINQLAPSPPDYANVGGIAYWQWAAGYFTLDDSPSYPSIVFSTNTVSGYPEISYFKNYYMLDKLIPQNQIQF